MAIALGDLLELLAMVSFRFRFVPFVGHATDKDQKTFRPVRRSRTANDS
jgi:hypothetical protein